MALSANTVLEVRTTGADTNGGGFVTGAAGADWSQQDSPQYSVTDGVAAGTTTLTSLTANFGTDVVGNLIYVSGGTGSITAGWYQITARASATSITVDRSTGLTAGTGVTLKIGGALLSPSIAASLFVAGMVAFVKSGTYSISSNSVATAGGAMSFASGSSLMIGYSTSRVLGNTDTQPVFQNNGSTITPTQSNCRFGNITFDGNSQTAARLSSAGNMFIGCTIKNYNTASTSGQTFVGCLVTANSANVAGSGNLATLLFSEIYANTATLTCALAVGCLSYLNTGASTDGLAEAGGGIIASCFSYGNGRDGFRHTSIIGHFVNCHAEGNGGVGFNGSTLGLFLVACGSYNNTGGRSSGTLLGDAAPITLSASAFVNAASGDFRLNALAAGGALLRAAGYIGFVKNVFPRGLTGSLLDIGAVQSRNLAARWDMTGGMN